MTRAILLIILFLQSSHVPCHLPIHRARADVVGSVELEELVGLGGTEFRKTINFISR